MSIFVRLAYLNIMNNYLKYSSMAFQMGTVIGLFTFVGYKLDQHYLSSKPYCTVIFSLLGVGISLYSVIKDFIKPVK